MPAGDGRGPSAGSRSRDSVLDVHLTDANIALGDLAAPVRAQARRYVARG